MEGGVYCNVRSATFPYASQMNYASSVSPVALDPRKRALRSSFRQLRRSDTSLAKGVSPGWREKTDRVP